MTLGELRFVPFRRPIFEEENLADRVQSERADDEIEFAGAAEIGRANVGHAAHILKQRDRLERAVRLAAKPDDAAAAAVGRGEAAEVGDEDVENPVAVEIDDIGGRRVRRLAQFAPLR